MWPLRQLSPVSPVLTLALAGWVNATRPDPDGGQLFGTTDPAADALAACWDGGRAPVDVVAALLRTAGAGDLADDRELTRAVAGRLPAVQSSRIDI